MGCAVQPTKLNQAILDGKTDKAIELIRNGENVDQYSQRGFAPIHIAVANNNMEVIYALISAGADLNARTIDGTNSLGIAIKNGNMAIVDALLKNGAVIDETKVGNSPLFDAVKRGDISFVQKVLDAGGELNHRNAYGETAIFYSSAYGNEAITSLLIKRGANLDLKTNDGRSPLHAAALNGHREVIDMLLDGGARLQEANENEQGIFATAKLYEYAGLRFVEEKQEMAAVDAFKTSIQYYRSAKSLFEERKNELQKEIIKRISLSVLSAVVAAADVQSQLQTNQILTPDGGTYAIGISTYSLPNTGGISGIKKLYQSAINTCDDKIAAISQQIQDILEISK
jgi:ankyrin repeat protein